MQFKINLFLGKEKRGMVLSHGSLVMPTKEGNVIPTTRGCHPDEGGIGNNGLIVHIPPSSG